LTLEYEASWLVGQATLRRPGSFPVSFTGKPPTLPLLPAFALTLFNQNSKAQLDCGPLRITYRLD
jgi:hypothetical protein